MAICQIMIQDFMSNVGMFDDVGEPMYCIGNLETGIQYCKDLIEFDGLTKEPFHHYDLVEFIKWAEKKIEEIRRRRFWQKESGSRK